MRSCVVLAAAAFETAAVAHFRICLGKKGISTSPQIAPERERRAFHLLTFLQNGWEIEEKHKK